MAGAFVALWRGHYFSAALGVAGTIISVANSVKIAKLGAMAATRLGKATAAVQRTASVAAIGGKVALINQAQSTGSAFWRSAVVAHDWVFCKGLKLACFTAGTPIRGEHGSVPVEAVRPGDRVWARNEHDPAGPVRLQLVEEVFERYAQVLEVHLPNGVVVGTTAEHPLWVVGRGWTPAAEVQPGDVFVGMDHQEVRVESLVETGRWERVYNFRVAGDHTYFVGADGWGFDVWAHNTCGVPHGSLTVCHGCPASNAAGATYPSVE